MDREAGVGEEERPICMERPRRRQEASAEGSEGDRRAAVAVAWVEAWAEETKAEWS